MPTATQRLPRYELHDGIAVVDVTGHEVTLRIAVGASDGPVCVVIAVYDVDVGTPNVVGHEGGWGDDGRHIVLSGVPAGIAQWVSDSHEVGDAAEDAWSAHIEACREHAVESGYCDARGM